MGIDAPVALCGFSAAVDIGKLDVSFGFVGSFKSKEGCIGIIIFIKLCGINAEVRILSIGVSVVFIPSDVVLGIAGADTCNDVVAKALVVTDGKAAVGCIKAS